MFRIAEGLRMLKEVERLLRMLLENRDVYFDKMGYLNSEGMKIVSRIARMIAEELPEYRGRIEELRAKRDLETVVKLLGDLHDKLPYLNQDHD